jgi:hypothetical protein
MMFNATFNNISVISWRSDLLVGETVVPGENAFIARLYVMHEPTQIDGPIFDKDNRNKLRP